MSNVEYNTLSLMDLWRLSDVLSVEDAAILIIGGNPGEKVTECVDNKDVEYVYWKGHKDYPAAFKALRNAILSNKLRADVKYSMRGAQFTSTFDESVYEISQGPDEEQVCYSFLISRSDDPLYSSSSSGQTRLNFSVDDIWQERFFYICREPNWEQTLVEVDDLKEWISCSGVFPPFFSPEGKAEGFRDKSHPRYSAKLGTAVAAWENVDAPEPHSSVKQTLSSRIRSNGEKYGVGDGKGIVSATAAEEVAKVANWNTKGGANPTPGPGDPHPTKQSEPIENYTYSSDQEASEAIETEEYIPF
ncbi:hypothetical protein [Rhodalgimonas zhirmunskyi]|uniref:Uncharacterized protein n=1 Tax=Rhodalgimonas zhirmunskyi TaxID=2964767 RepID=A0AAJ1U318_9RHOB|nr:hypothetical protein [Rhodoalgimonas zhirmunskyi]MDQ2092740.1 hypothetical protein [Rhodoalgimonas zhirmunskyi]